MQHQNWECPLNVWSGSSIEVIRTEGLGCGPRWSHDGKELYYVEGDTLIELEVSTMPSFRVDEARRLFQHPNLSVGSYDVAADGRFVMVENVADENTVRTKRAVRVIENWDEEFRDRE